MKKNKDIKLIGFIFGIILIAIVAILCYFFVISKKNKDNEKEKNNNKNERIVTNLKFDDYTKIIKDADMNFTILGQKGCSACNSYYPIYNEVSNKYNLKIYYYELNTLSEEELTKIINYEFVIPAKCSTLDHDFKLTEKFYTPLSLFIKKGKVIDCIDGAVDESVLVEKLKELKILE